MHRARNSGDPPAEPPNELTDLARRYRLRRRLGSGEMGEVYEAHDLELDRRVAVKVAFEDPRLDDAAWVARFLRQGQALARIEHPHIVTVYDRGLHERRRPFVVMEFLDGPDLAELLRSHGALAPTTAIELGLQLCHAVAAMHARGVIHRDLKPGNLVVLNAGSATPVLKIVDFGIAKLDAAARLTGTRDVLGTLAYIPPELLDDPRAVSPAADMYTLGGVLFEMLTGRHVFHARSRATLLQAIRNDPPASVHELVSGISEELSTLITSLLAKLPAERPDANQAASALLRMRVPVESTSAFSGRDTGYVGQVLAQRFELMRLLGEGSHGTVYEAHDRKHDKLVALKRLHGRGPTDLYRLKREFRTLSSLAHAQLVRIEELHLTSSVAFFTMELLTGPAFLDACAESVQTALRLLAQVAEGLSAIHAHGLVHRDLKPPNVRLASDGRVVLLDFGLSVRLTTQTDVAGTPAYMAPELLEGQVGKAADMFAFGVLLHEALCGRRPEGRPLSAHEPEIPAPVSALCDALLATDPGARPDAEQALRTLQQALAGELGARRSSVRMRVDTPFVGRDAELSALTLEASSVATGARARSVVVHGPSGIGKTRLLQRLGEQLSGRGVVLQGACRQAESIPFPAFDSVVDALSAYLQTLPYRTTRALLPQEIGALTLLFPVLLRVDAVASAAPRATTPVDPLETRTRAFQGFKDLLRRLARERPVTLVLDDVQWIDADSVALLAHCLAPPEPPPFLLVCGLRDSAARLPESFAQLLDGMGSVRRIHLAPLAEHACRALVPWFSRVDLSSSATDRIIEQSGGHPLLLTMLVAHASTLHDEANDHSLDRALLDHAKRLPGAVQDLLALVSLCARPLPRALLMKLCPAHAQDACARLQQERLTVRVDIAGVERIEIYHARVREAVLSGLTPEQRRALHLRLADALVSCADETDARVEHLQGAGLVAQAARVAIEAAGAASAQLAFDRAAALYETALKLGEGTVQQRVFLLEKQAGALRARGRTRAAGKVLQEAAAMAPESDTRRLLIEAGRHLLSAGDIDGGLRVLGPVLDNALITLPNNLAELSRAATEAYQSLSARGLAPNVPDRVRDVKMYARLELQLCLAQALAHADVRGIICAFEALHAALELGDESVLQRAAAMFVIATAAHMNTPLITPVLLLCQRLTPGKGVYAEALSYAAEAEAAHFSAQFVAAEIAFERAERLLLESCIGATRELSTVRNGAVLLQYSQKGDFRTYLPRTLSWLTDAEAREDLFHASMLRCAHAIVWIAQDDPERARRELTRAEREWQDADGIFEVATVFYFDIIDRYLADETAHLHPAQGRSHVLQGPAAENPFLGGYIHLHRAWGSIRALAHGGGRRDREMAEAAIRGMRELGPQIWQAVADAFDANLQFLHGDLNGALTALEHSERNFRGLHMLCLAACVRRRRGELAGGAFGERIVDAADAELRALGVVAPLRWCRAYFSIFPTELAAQRTLTS